MACFVIDCPLFLGERSEHKIACSHLSRYSLAGTRSRFVYPV